MNTKTKEVKGLKLLFLNLTKGISGEGKSRLTGLKYPLDTEEVIDINDIIVPYEIQHSKPNVHKVIEYTKRFEQNGMIDKAITISKEFLFGSEYYQLRDGYIRLIILRQNGINEVPVKFEK